MLNATKDLHDHDKLQQAVESDFFEWMNLKIVEYIPCRSYAYTLIGKSKQRQYITQIGKIWVFEVTTTWICLKCNTIQAEKVEIRDILEN